MQKYLGIDNFGLKLKDINCESKKGFNLDWIQSIAL